MMNTAQYRDARWWLDRAASARVRGEYDRARKAIETARANMRRGRELPCLQVPDPKRPGWSCWQAAI